MKSCKDLVYVMFQISAVGIGNWSFWNYLEKDYVRLDVNRSATHCKGSPKNSHLVQTFQTSKVSNLVANLMQKTSPQLGLILSSIWWCKY